MRILGELDYQIVTLSELERIEVYLTWAGDAFGGQNYGEDGHINVPAISLARLRKFLGYETASLRDVLRHE